MKRLLIPIRILLLALMVWILATSVDWKQTSSSKSVHLTAVGFSWLQIVSNAPTVRYSFPQFRNYAIGQYALWRVTKECNGTKDARIVSITDATVPSGVTGAPSLRGTRVVLQGEFAGCYFPGSAQGGPLPVFHEVSYVIGDQWFIPIEVAASS